MSHTDVQVNRMRCLQWQILQLRWLHLNLSTPSKSTTAPSDVRVMLWARKSSYKKPTFVEGLAHLQHRFDASGELPPADLCYIKADSPLGEVKIGKVLDGVAGVLHDECVKVLLKKPAKVLWDDCQVGHQGRQRPVHLALVSQALSSMAMAYLIANRCP